MTTIPEAAAATVGTVTAPVGTALAVRDTAPPTRRGKIPRAEAAARAVASVAAVTHDNGGAGGVLVVTTTWLAELESDNTVRAYTQAIVSWCGYCHAHGLDAMTALPTHVSAWVLQNVERALQPWKPSTVNARLSALSAWYNHLALLKASDSNPTIGVRRRKVSQDATETTGMDSEHVGALLDYLEHRSDRGVGPEVEVRCRDYALVWLLVATASRSGGVAHALRTQFRSQRGHRVLKFDTKGKTHVVPVDQGAAAALDCYLDARDDRLGADPDLGVCVECGKPLADHLFLTTPWRGHEGNRPLHAQLMSNLISRHAAGAGVPHADELVPHSLRHAAITAALDEGVPLARVQDLAGHADPRTTRRYDHNRDRLDQSAVYELARRWARHRNHDDHQDEQPAPAAGERTGPPA